jgi:hypothetical protein
MDSLIKRVFTEKTPWQMLLTIWALLFYMMVTPICLAIAVIGLCIYGGERWSELAGSFNKLPIMKRLASLVVPAV